MLHNCVCQLQCMVVLFCPESRVAHEARDAVVTLLPTAVIFVRPSATKSSWTPPPRDPQRDPGGQPMRGQYRGVSPEGGVSARRVGSSQRGCPARHYIVT